MAFVKAFSDTNQSKKPFLDVYMSDNPDVNFKDTAYQALSISFSPKGLMVHFEYFIIFIFKSSDKYEQLTALIDEYLSQPTGRLALCVLLTDNYGSYDFVFDTEETINVKKVGKKILLNCSQEDTTREQPQSLLETLKSLESTKKPTTGKK